MCNIVHNEIPCSRENQHGSHQKDVPVLLTFLFEGKILCQMSTFMVSPQKKQRLWVEDFQ